MCLSFAGKLWDTDAIPHPPLHPDCKCSLIYSDLFDPADVQTELTALSPQAHAALVRLTVHYLFAHTTLPAVLLPFVD